MADHVSAPIQIPASLLDDLNKLGAVLNEGLRALNLAQQMVERMHKDLDGAPFGSDYRMLAYVLFSKGFMTFQSVRGLCVLGCGPDAIGLCASLFENVVDLTYIRQAPTSRSRRYVRFEQVDKYYQAQKILRRRRLPKGTRKRYKGYLKFLAPEATKYLRMFPTARNGWSGKRLRERAQAVKMDLEYDELYYLFCGTKHTLPMGAASFVFERDAYLDVVRGPNIKGVYLAALHSTVYLLRLCDLFQDAYGLSAEAKEIGPLMKSLIEASNEVQRQYPELCK
jgi:hypothetical protein